LGASQIASYVAYSTDAGTTWVNQVLSDSTFTDQEPNSDVRFGDYIQLDAFSGKVIPVWTDQRKGYPNQEIYTANLNGLIPVSLISSEYRMNSTSFKLPKSFPFNEIQFDIPNL
jgi:hypothetical protein